MTGSSASSGEMPRVPMPGRAGRDQDEQLLDMILDGRPLPPKRRPGCMSWQTISSGWRLRPVQVSCQERQPPWLPSSARARRPAPCRWRARPELAGGGSGSHRVVPGCRLRSPRW